MKIISSKKFSLCLNTLIFLTPLFIFGVLLSVSNSFAATTSQIPEGLTIVKTYIVPGTKTQKTEYSDGSFLTVMPNEPNPPIVTYVKADGSRFDIDNETNTGTETVPPRPSTQPTSNNTTPKKTPANDNVLEQIIKADTFKGQPLNNLLNQLFWTGLIGAVILAVIMIIRGGIEYMTIDSIDGKSRGKSRVQAALGGLLLAFSTILILNTINPGLTKLKITFPRLQEVKPVTIESDIINSVNQFAGLTPQQVEEMLATGKIPTNISPAAQKILAQAMASINTLHTGTIDGTNQGRLACAAAVNMIVQRATGQPIGGNLSTAAMYEILKTSSKFALVPGGMGASQPGDIIISPNQHVGIVSESGARKIISNSSNAKVVKDHRNAGNWASDYGTSNTYIYRPL